jgi:hypothetical protein
VLCQELGLGFRNLKNLLNVGKDLKMNIFLIIIGVIVIIQLINLDRLLKKISSKLEDVEISVSDIVYKRQRMQHELNPDSPDFSP